MDGGQNEYASSLSGRISDASGEEKSDLSVRLD
jgi:hypothetical protein